jgi:hypothetical protein
MQQIREIMKALPTEPHVLPEKATSEKPRNAALRRLWARMSAIYGHKWTSAYGEACEDVTGALTIPGDTWARGLAGVAEAKIGSGLNAALMSADGWPPSLPAFRALCFGIPSLATVKHELATKQRSPFVVQVWRYLDSYRFSRANQDDADRMLSDAYYLASEHVMAGGALPDAPIAEIAQEPEQLTPANDNTARIHIAELEALLGLGNASDSGQDHTDSGARENGA